MSIFDAESLKKKAQKGFKAAKKGVKRALDVETNREEKRIRNRTDLEKMKKKLESQLVIQRRIYNSPDTTKHQKDMAKERVSTMLCAHAITRQAIEQIEMAGTDADMNHIMSKLNKTLRYVKSMEPGISGLRQKSIEHSVEAIKEYGEGVRAENVFTQKTQDIVSEDWMGMQVGEATDNFLKGEELDECLQAVKEHMDSAGILGDDSLFAGEESDGGKGKDNDIWLDLNLFDS